MQLSRLFLLLFTIFCFGGVSETFAQAKPTKPKITRHPASATLQFGQSVTFSVQHNAGPGVTYQWRRNKRPLPDADESSYTIATVFVEDAGKYDVVVTNSRGATASKAATLTVNLAPASLPLDAVLYGEFIIRAYGETIESDGAYVVSGPGALIDPENPSDAYRYTYSRLPRNKAKFTINGRYFDSDLGAYVTSKESYSLVFTGVAPNGELIAAVTAKGTLTAPPGYKPAKINFTARGTISIEGAELYNFVPNTGGAFGGSVTVAAIGGGNTYTGELHKVGSSSPGLNTGNLISINTPEDSENQGILILDGGPAVQLNEGSLISITTLPDSGNGTVLSSSQSSSIILIPDGGSSWQPNGNENLIFTDSLVDFENESIFIPGQDSSESLIFNGSSSWQLDGNGNLIWFESTPSVQWVNP